MPQQSTTSSDIIITALDSIFWIESAWKSVSETTIKKTFKAAGFKEEKIEHVLNDITSDVVAVTQYQRRSMKQQQILLLMKEHVH